ncbi:MAG: M23 family metallopeptidase [Aestuariibacter sp.]
MKALKRKIKLESHTASRSLLTIVCCVLIFLLLIPFAYADQYCDENWACAGADREGEYLAFWMENRKPWPITLTLKISTRNLLSRDNQKGKFVVTRVLDGYQKKSVLTLKPSRHWRDIRYRYSMQWTVGDMNAQHNDTVRYQLPYAKGRYYPIIQGYNGNYSHTGNSKYALDFAMPVGAPVHAARSGVVVDVTEKNWRGGASRRYAKYANFIVLLHDDGTTGEYYHLAQWGAVVNLGDQVKSGQLIGYSGNTGFSSRPHLHFAVYKAKPHGSYQSIPVKFEKSATDRYQRQRAGE